MPMTVAKTIASPSTDDNLVSPRLEPPPFDHLDVSPNIKRPLPHATQRHVSISASRAFWQTDDHKQLGGNHRRTAVAGDSGRVGDGSSSITVKAAGHLTIRSSAEHLHHPRNPNLGC